jgi:hypothetical protein
MSMTKMPELLPEERQKLLTLLRRSDALSQAYDVVFDAEDFGDVEMQAWTLWRLGELSAEAYEEFAAYRAELGIAN